MSASDARSNSQRSSNGFFQGVRDPGSEVQKLKIPLNCKHLHVVKGSFLHYSRFGILWTRVRLRASLH